jgi:hypothetical protein
MEQEPKIAKASSRNPPSTTPTLAQGKKTRPNKENEL